MEPRLFNLDPQLLHDACLLYTSGHAHVGPFEHECFKQVSTDMLLEAGVTLLLHTFFVDVVMEEKRISGVVVANKSGMSVIRAKIVIDCSGDADVAAKAGVPFELGNRCV